MNPIDWLLLATTLIAILCWLVILILRAIISAKIFTEDQFAEFSTNGISQAYWFLPPRIFWEYKFITRALGASQSPQTTKLLYLWKITFRVLLAAVITIPVALAAEYIYHTLQQ